jgi:hypothetical protein
MEGSSLKSTTTISSVPLVKSLTNLGPQAKHGFVLGMGIHTEIRALHSQRESDRVARLMFSVAAMLLCTPSVSLHQRSVMKAVGRIPCLIT